MNTSQALERFGALSRLMSVGVVLLDAAADLEYANPIAGELIGCSDEEEAGARWAALKRHARLDAKTISAGPSPLRLMMDVPLDGAARCLRLEIHTLAHPRCEGFLVLMRDRQSVDALETSLLLASQMRSAVHVNRALAHDLRAPLNSMQLTLDLLSDSMEGTRDSRRVEHYERHMAILREELARLNEILRFALDRNESANPAPQAFDLREVLRESSRLLGPQARRQRVEIDLRFTEQSAIVTGRRDRVKQALINLMTDALDAMTDGGRLVIDLTVTGRAASIAIRGGTVSAYSLDDIYRIHAAGAGTGNAIGLYVARVVAESHGGEITAEGEPGRNLYFRMTLPLDAQLYGANDYGARQASAGGGRR